MTWSPFAEDIDVARQHEQEAHDERVQLLAELEKVRVSLAFYESEGYASHVEFLNTLIEQRKALAIITTDPVAHAEERGKYHILGYLAALPLTLRLEYDRLKARIEELEPVTDNSG